MLNRCTLIGLALLLAALPASADVAVWLEPADAAVAVGGTVDVEIMACFEAPVVGWGLDLGIADAGLAAWIGTAIGDDWDASDSIDEDGLAGLRFGEGVSGTVLLGTLTFEGLVEGATSLSLSSGPEEDEGFLFESGDLASTVSFCGGTLTVVPEPCGLALIVMGVLAGIRRR